MTANSKRVSHAAIQTIANVVSTIVAVAALIYSSITYQSTVHFSKRDQARRDWSDFLEMTGENPDLSFDKSIVGSSENEIDEYRNRQIAFMDRMYFYMNSVVESDGIDIWKSQIDIYLKKYGVLECRFEAFRPHKRLLTRGYSPDFAAFLVDFYEKNCARIIKDNEYSVQLKGMQSSLQRYGMGKTN